MPLDSLEEESHGEQAVGADERQDLLRERQERHEVDEAEEPQDEEAGEPVRPTGCLARHAVLRPAGRAGPQRGRPGAAADGSSGQACFGYRPRRIFRTSGYVVRQKLARSSVIWTGRAFGASSSKTSGTRPAATRGVAARPKSSWMRAATTGGRSRG